MGPTALGRGVQARDRDSSLPLHKSLHLQVWLPLREMGLRIALWGGRGVIQRLN